MLQFSRRAFLSHSLCWRAYSTTTPKTTVQLVSELRKLTEAPISKARQALKETNNDLDAARAWLEKDLLASGIAKAEKIKDRAATDGLISISLVNEKDHVRAAIIELSSETDFVSRTDQFARVAGDVSHTAACSSASTSTNLVPTDIQGLLDQNLEGSTSTVKSSVMELIARTGENISVRRACALAWPTAPGQQLRIGTYLHNSPAGFSSQGRIGVLAILALRSSGKSFEAFEPELQKLQKALARQIAVNSTKSIETGSDEETVLYKQPFGMLADSGDAPVEQVLADYQVKWGLDGLQVVDFVKWEVGEALD